MKTNPRIYHGAPLPPVSIETRATLPVPAEMSIQMEIEEEERRKEGRKEGREEDE